jgi:hypothetical protein
VDKTKAWEEKLHQLIEEIAEESLK